jgi:hypothetical protein
MYKGRKDMECIKEGKTGNGERKDRQGMYKGRKDREEVMTLR